MKYVQISLWWVEGARGWVGRVGNSENKFFGETDSLETNISSKKNE